MQFAFMCVAHFFDHLCMLIYASVVALTLSQDWGMSYGELIPYATPGFIAFGVCAVPSGWLADKWSRTGMMLLFFVGIGSSSILTSFAQTPTHMGIGLFIIGVFASIYHPVGISLVVQGRKSTGIPLAVNGIFGNLGVASAPLIAGYLIDHVGWRSAFYLPGLFTVVGGLVYAVALYATRTTPDEADPVTSNSPGAPRIDPRLIRLTFTLVLVSTAIGGLVFQSTTFALPKVFSERLGDLAITAGSSCRKARSGGTPSIVSAPVATTIRSKR